MDIETARDKVRYLFQSIARGAPAEARIARKELNADHLRVRGRDVEKKVFIASFCDELLTAYSSITDDGARARYLGALGEVVYRMRIRREALLEIVLREVLHSSAHVRLGAVRLGEHLRVMTYFTHRGFGDLDMPSVIKIHIRIKELTATHAPREWYSQDEYDPVVVQELSASVPKSLLLLWCVFSNVGMFTDDFVAEHPECADPFPLTRYNW